MSLMTQVGMEFIARDKSRAGTMSLGRNLNNLQRRFRGFGRTLLAVAGIGGIGYVIKQQMAAIDSTAKLSDRLGITTEALIGMQHGAGIAGVQQETLNKSLEIFSRRLGEVDMDVGQAKYALDKLGLTYTELIGKSPDEAIGIVADQINKLSTQAEKAAAANYLFGRSGQQLLNMFESGSEGIEAYRIEAEKLGLSFSRIDAAKVEAANDSLTRTRAVFTGLFRQGTIELAPYIEALSNAFVEFATQGEGVGANVVNAFEGIALSVVTVAEEVEGLLIKLNQLTSPIDAMRAATEANQKAIARYRAQTGETEAFRYTAGPLYAPTQPNDRALFERIQAEEKAKAGIGVASRRGEVSGAFADIRSRAEANAKARAIEVEASRMAGIKAPGGSAGIDEGAVVERTNAQILADTREQLASVRAMHDKTRMEKIRMLEDYKKAHFDHTAEIEAGERLLNDEILALRRSRVDAMKVYMAELREDMEDSALYISEKYAEAARSIESSMSGAFESMIADGASFRDAMEGFLRDVGRAFARMAADMTARAVQEAWIAPVMSGLAGAFAGGGSYYSSNMQAPAGGFPGSSTLHSGWVPEGTPSFQRGRGLKSNEMAAVIEKDELLVPNDKIVKGGRRGGGSAPNIIIYNESGQAIEKKGEPEFDGESWVVSLIAQNYTEGGSLKKLLR